MLKRSARNKRANVFTGGPLPDPDEGAGIEITLYDDYVSVDMPSAAGTDEDWKDVWRYLEILVSKGGFVVWDPQGPNLVDLAAGPFGDGKRERESTARTAARQAQAGASRTAADDDGPDDIER